MSSYASLFLLLLLFTSFDAVVVVVVTAAETKVINLQYKILSSTRIASELESLAINYPYLATLTTAQAAFDLPFAGTPDDCTFSATSNSNSNSNSNAPGCPNYILTIHDPIANPPGSFTDSSLPEVFLSGALHGNERVGPTAVLETAKLLLEAAQCESLPQFIAPPDPDTEQGSKWLLQAQQGESCRNKLIQGGITHSQRKWLARLVATRRIVIVPMTNALGYDRNERTEDGIDPNRDFPYDVTSPDMCMQTIAGRTVNELFRKHLFQMSLTFHAGTEVVGYEWGAFPYLPTNISPDDVAQVEIGRAYSSFAGGFQGTNSYKTGTMNELVYAVKGGMEDWAYAASWDTDKVTPCQPTTYGGYDKSKTLYNQSSLRAFNMLIETSNDKIPNNHFGSSHGILEQEPSFENNGHVARNIRLALSAIDLVQPYVSIWGANMVPLQNDVVPMMPRPGRICAESKIMKIPQNQKETNIGWTVGGGFNVDFTNLIFAKWEDVPLVMDCARQPLQSELGVAFRTTETISGPTKWKANWQKNNSNGVNEGEPMFFSTIDTSMFQPGDRIAVFAVARLDQGWNDVPDGAKPNIAPQSHMVNARTNPAWRHESAGKIIQGRQDWYSIPLTLVISDDSDDYETAELSDRFIIPDIDLKKPHDFLQPRDNGNGNQGNINEEDDEIEDTERTSPQEGKGNGPNTDGITLPSPNFVLILVLFAFCGVVVYKLGKWIRRRKSGRERVSILDDDDVFVHEFTFDEDIQLRELA